MRTKALWREGKEMGSCGALSSGDAAERYPVEMLQALSGGDAASTAQWRCCKRCLVEMLQALPSGDAAKRCPVEMLRSAACLTR